MSYKFYFSSAFDRLHCHLEKGNDGSYLDERMERQQIISSLHSTFLTSENIFIIYVSDLIEEQ